MKFRMTCTAAAVAGALAHGAVGAQTEETTTIDTEMLGVIAVTAPTAEPATTTIETADLPAARETADLLRDIPGVRARAWAVTAPTR